MASTSTNRVNPQQLDSDVDAFAALKGLTGYTPHNPRYSIESIGAALDAMRAADEAVIRANNTLTVARETLATAERTFHEMILGVKAETKVLFGEDSDELAALGLKRKSDRARPKRSSKPTLPTKES